MTRIALALAALAVAICFDMPSSQAGTYGDAPWCSVQYLGMGEQQWDCEYNSAAACAPTVVAGNRGFCNLNPYYVAERPPAAPRAWPHPRRRHHVRHD